MGNGAGSAPPEPDRMATPALPPGGGRPFSRVRPGPAAYFGTGPDTFGRTRLDTASLKQTPAGRPVPDTCARTPQDAARPQRASRLRPAASTQPPPLAAPLATPQPTPQK